MWFVRFLTHSEKWVAAISTTCLWNEHRTNWFRGMIWTSIIKSKYIWTNHSKRIIPILHSHCKALKLFHSSALPCVCVCASLSNVWHEAKCNRVCWHRISKLFSVLLLLFLWFFSWCVVFFLFLLSSVIFTLFSVLSVRCFLSFSANGAHLIALARTKFSCEARTLQRAVCCTVCVVRALNDQWKSACTFL